MLHKTSCMSYTSLPLSIYFPPNKDFKFFKIAGSVVLVPLHAFTRMCLKISPFLNEE